MTSWGGMARTYSYSISNSTILLAEKYLGNVTGVIQVNLWHMHNRCVKARERERTPAWEIPYLEADTSKPHEYVGESLTEFSLMAIGTSFSTRH